MKETKINSKLSYEILNEIVNYLNKVETQIKLVEDEIETVSNQAWECPSSNVFKTKTLKIMKEFHKQNIETKMLIKLMIDKIGNYEKIDKKIINSLYGSANL